MAEQNEELELVRGSGNVFADFAAPDAGLRQLRALLGKIVGGVEAFDGVLPVAAKDQIVPVRNEVAEGATVDAERDTAVHAT